ncbi:MAG: prolipoprotein diacylglyceryl transferase [Candidatus Krumholzibacteria bacterium]|nr:prolipoprotein diacylglyceryl transferase [Candidatus Krumholzibacteria bacterium]
MLWYNVFSVLGCLVGSIVLVREFRRQQLPARWAIGLAAVVFIVSRVGAHLAYSMEKGAWSASWESYLSFSRGGLSLFGGLYLAIAAVLVFAGCIRVPWLQLMDLLAPAAAFSFAVGRLGCLMAGCCRGFALPVRATFPAWFPGNHCFPAPLLDSIVNLSIGMYLLRVQPSAAEMGRRAGLFLALYCLSRFLIEMVRSNQAIWVGLTMAQLLAVPGFFIGLWLVTRRSLIRLAIVACKK